ncbi:MAG: hypothetical protein WC508_01080 [Patescibacteria group bacterium]
MIIQMITGVQATDSRVEAIVQKAILYGLSPQVQAEAGVHFIAVLIHLKDGKAQANSIPEHVFQMDGVERVLRVSPSQVSPLRNGGDHHLIEVGGSLIGPGQPCRLVAGQCAIDKHIGLTVQGLVKLGVQDLRGGWKKPRSKAEGFRGFGEAGLENFLRAAAANDVRSVWMEVMESPDIEIVRRCRDRTSYRGDIVLWVGARTQNYCLLEALGLQKEFVVMIKHGLTMTRIDELMDLAGWVLYGPMFWDEDGRLDPEKSAPSGNQKIIFCVRGLRKVDTHDPHRFYPNFSWINELHSRSWAPVCLDPSHMAGRVDLVFEDLQNGLKHSPDVVMVETHVKPAEALCDKDQAIPLERVPELITMITEHNAHRGQQA